LTGKYFGAGDAPNIIHMSEAGQHAMTQCRALGYRIDYTRAGIRIFYPPPSALQALAYSLDDFLAITRGILASHGLDTATAPESDTEEDAFLAPHSHPDSIARLVALSRKAIAERDAWKSRAQEAEQALSALQAQAARSSPRDGTSGTTGDARYNRLKRIIAQELHPDSQAPGAEQRLKTEVFKVIWRRMQDMEREG